MDWILKILLFVCFLWEQSFFDIEFHTKYVGGISSNLIGIGMPLFPFSRITYIFTHQLLAITILTVTAFLCSRLNNSPRREIWYWFGFALILAFLMSSLSEPIWLASSTLQKIQFAWRLLAFFSFVGAALCAITVREIFKLRSSLKLLLSLIIAGILLVNFSYSYKQSREFIALRNPGRANIDHLVYIKRILDDPYTDKLRDYLGYRPALKNGLAAPNPVIGQPRISLIHKISTRAWNLSGEFTLPMDSCFYSGRYSQYFKYYGFDTLSFK